MFDDNDGDHEMLAVIGNGVVNQDSGATADGGFNNYFASGETPAGNNQFEIDDLGLGMELALDEIE